MHTLINGYVLGGRIDKPTETYITHEKKNLNGTGSNRGKLEDNRVTNYTDTQRCNTLRYNH